MTNETENTSPVSEQAKKTTKKARVTKQKTVEKPAVAPVQKRASAKKVTAPIVTSEEAPKFSFNELKKQLIEAEKRVLHAGTQREKLVASIGKHAAALTKAEEALIDKRQIAREKGTAASKRALEKARAAKSSAEQTMRALKQEYRAAKDASAQMARELNRLVRAEARLLKMVMAEEARLIKKLLAEEKALLKSLHAPKRRKRRSRTIEGQVTTAADECVVLDEEFDLEPA